MILLNTKRIVVIILSFFLYISTGCVSFKNTHNRYSDQKELICKHHEEGDARNDKSSKFGILYLQQNDKILASDDIYYLFKRIVSKNNRYKFSIDDVKNFRKKALHRRLQSKINYLASLFKKKQDELNTIKKHEDYDDILFDETQEENNDKEKSITLTENELKIIFIIGKKLKYDFIIIPWIERISSEKKEVLRTIAPESRKAGFSWPAFEVKEMELEAEAKVNLYCIDIKNRKVTGIFNGFARIADTYDTDETYREKRNSIITENEKRRRENNRRDEIRENEDRERQKRKVETKADLAFEILDLALDIATSDYRLKMVDERTPYKKSKYKNSKILNIDLLYKSCSFAFSKFFDKYDGITISGDTVNGTGTFLFKNGDTYTGEWKRRKAHGNGHYTYKNGSYYKGMFFDGLAHGDGFYQDLDGNTYYGGYMAGLKNGTGIYTPLFNEVVKIDKKGYATTGGFYGNSIKTGEKYYVICKRGLYIRMIEYSKYLKSKKRKK